ncbi:hypothetical protein L6164_027256 [Bauhinia variegata]|uniref:Uncharacterized protein n=1 Tax=Bauhinia variegata TaxID=167791 RepID=A0ACB9LTK2_BAUVA|nr:hypothetical protein L6164_027256 [Bauhinia variegata]
MLWRHPENVELENIKVVHYCSAGSKPWRYRGKEVNMDREDIKIEGEFSRSSIMSAIPETRMSFIPAPSAA